MKTRGYRTRPNSLTAVMCHAGPAYSEEVTREAKHRAQQRPRVAVPSSKVDEENVDSLRATLRKLQRPTTRTRTIRDELATHTV